MGRLRPNPKMFHLMMILLIYGADTESVKCPESCTCIETLISDRDNSTNQINFDGRNFSKIDLGHQNLNKILSDSILVGGGDVSDGGGGGGDEMNEPKLNSIEESETSSPNKEKNKCSKNNREKVREVFQKYNFSTNPVNNSKERRRRSLNVNRGANVESRRTGEANQEGRILLRTHSSSERESKSNGSEKEGKNSKEKEIFTYQITCDGLRDLKSKWLRNLPNLTAEIVIRKTFFQSFGLFRETLRESPAGFDRLTIFSLSDSVINQKKDENYSFKMDSPGREKNFNGNPNRREEFIPFGFLENPKLRSKPEPEIPSSFGKERKFEKVKVLNLVNDTITFLPQDTFRPFYRLEILNLSSNLIEFIERETFRPLGNLLQLDLQKNRLLFLDELIFENLTKLIYLDVSQNSISKIAPSTFQYLTSLNALNLAGNPLSEKQEAVILLGTGKRLQMVDISKTGLKQIPGTLERSVRILNLMGNRLPSIRCGDLDSYSLLSYLNLRENKISYVEDDALGRLEFLKSLQIGRNNLFQIPKSLPNNLEILNLSYNNVQNITNSDFLDLSMLKELFMSHNQVSGIERNAFDSLVRLRVLDLSHNPILILPNVYGLAKLTALNLSHFTNIPGTSTARYSQFPIRSPENIRELNLESSPLLTSIFLQDTNTLGSFVELEQLDVRFSNLTTMRKDIFRLLSKLRVFKVGGNPWHCGKEILILSNWLKDHKGENAIEEEGDDVNTAHCSTPAHLYKVSLVSLEERHFEIVPDKKSSEEFRIENGTVDRETRTENLSKQNSEISGSVEESPKEKSVEAIDSSGGRRNNPEVKKVNLNKWYADGGGKAETFSEQKAKEENLSVLKNRLKNSQESLKEESSSKRNFTLAQLLPDKRISTETSRKPTTDFSFRNDYDNNFVNRSDKTLSEFLGIPVKGASLGLKTTPVSFGAVKKAEAVTGKELHSIEKEFNSHLSFFILSSVGLLIMATLTFTSVYFSRTRRDRPSYQRQSQDIEVCSISSMGNELW